MRVRPAHNPFIGFNNFGVICAVLMSALLLVLLVGVFTAR